MLKYGWKDSSDHYYANQRLNQLKLSRDQNRIMVLKNECFATQLLLWSDLETHYTFDHDKISWHGVHLKTYRVEASSWRHQEGGELTGPKMNFVDFVNDDEGRLVSDPIVPDRGMEREAGCVQGIWVEDCFSTDAKQGIYKSEITIYCQEGYDQEVIIDTLELTVQLLDVEMVQLKNSDFFLDLWQHPSNWARTYRVKMWSASHFKIIKSHLKEMAKLGQKVITIIASDYPWAGQRCYDVHKNHANLFEHNMVQILKNKEGTFTYDFGPMKRYIEIAQEMGIDAEIDVFGLLGNWDAFAFGNPVEGYRDPIRLKYKNSYDGTYGYISKLDDVKAYIKALFDELNDIGVWDKVRVICDEPDHPESFNANVNFLKGLTENDLKIKSAIHVPKIMPLASELMNDLSLGMNIVGKRKGELQDIHEKLQMKNGKLTWYVCCFPSRPNNFLSSPRLESRLIGWLTHYFNLDGFLRWDFAIWPDDPYNDTSYKYPKWTAGDMFFVYPGKDMTPVSSQRLKNLHFGIQDYEFLNMLERELSSERKNDFYQSLEELLGKKLDIKVDELEVDMDYSLIYDHYRLFKEHMMIVCQEMMK